MPVKKIDGLPSVDKIEDEIAQVKEQKKVVAVKKKSGRGFKIVFVILGAVAIILGVMAYGSGNLAINFAGTGSVTGNVVNGLGTPVPAQIFVLSTKLGTAADALGNFRLDSIPAGKKELIITYQGQGVDKPVEIISGQTTSLGTIQVQSTQIPAQ